MLYNITINVTRIETDLHGIHLYMEILSAFKILNYIQIYNSATFYYQICRLRNILNIHNTNVWSYFINLFINYLLILCPKPNFRNVEQI